MINLGSLCIDRVFSVDHVARGGETILAADVQVFAGGKGLNQSLAARRAGAEVLHVGCIGDDGEFLRTLLNDEGVDNAFVRTIAGQPTGNAMIQVTARGENAIVIVGGANRLLTRADFEHALAAAGPQDWLLLQNEINDLDVVLRVAAARGLRTCLNFAPCDDRGSRYPFEGVALLVVNEIEAEGITACADPQAALFTLRQKRCPNGIVVVTLGEQGLLYAADGAIKSLPAFTVQAIDGTGAGDAFIGFLLAALLQDASLEDALISASAAGAITASRLGAAPAIPTAAEVSAFMRDRVATG